MDVPPSAVSLARALLSLSRTRASGVLSVRSETALCRIALVDGALRAAVSNAAELTLGDLLVRDAACEPAALFAALHHESFRPPAGAWLMQHGLANHDTITRALRQQLHERVRAVFRWPAHELDFRVGPAEVGVYGLPDALPVEPLVLAGMRFAVEGRPYVLDRSDPRVFELAAWAHGLLAHRAATEADRALHDVLRAGATAGQVTEAAENGAKSALTWHALVAFRALVPRTRSHVAYALLLRKRAQLQRRAGARELLDLAHDVDATPGVARTALRRLAMHLHPDRFGPDAPSSARELSNEVMRALTRAASSLAEC